MSAKNFFALVVVAFVVLGMAGQAVAWSPSSVSGLTSWLDPSVVAGKVTYNGSNQVTAFVDSAGGWTWAKDSHQSNYPTYNVNAFGTGVAGLVYSGSADLAYGTAGSVISSTGQLTAFAVINSTVAGNGSTMWSVEYTSVNTNGELIWQVNSENGSNRLGVFQRGTPGTGGDFLLSPSNAVSLSTNHIVEMDFNSGAMSMYVDGTNVTPLTGTVPTALPSYGSGWSVLLGTQSGTNAFQGTIGDMLFYSAALSSTDRNNVGYYLAQKYGISNSTYVGTYVPEPSSLVLLAAGLLGLLCYAWRKRK